MYEDPVPVVVVCVLVVEPVVASIVYDVIVLPFEEGVTHVTVAVGLPPLTVTESIDVASGVEYGVMVFVVSEEELFPAAFVATTLNTYETPYDSPVKDRDEALDTAS